jgi:6-phosphogluconolactonase
VPAPEVRIGDLAFVAEQLAADFAAEAQAPIAARQKFKIAIPGGSVAERCFPALAALPLDWSQLEFFWVDERAVPPEHEDSNYRLAKQHWLDPAAVPPARVHRMIGERELDESARSYVGMLIRWCGLPVKLDYVLLGVGPDGHVASLFPGRSNVANMQGIVLVEPDAPKPPPRRLTLAMPVLTNAARVAVVALGETKAAVMAEALGQHDSSLPVARVVRRASRVLVLMDDAAAARVPR